jgi:hypothetical protein
MEAPSDEQLAIVFYHGAFPLWKYLEFCFDIDIREVCDRVAKDEPVVKSNDKELAVRMVQTDHKNELGPMFNNDIIFLLNAVNVVFNTLKLGIMKDEKKILESYKFKLDAEYNMYMVDEEDDAVNAVKLSVVPITFDL